MIDHVVRADVPSGVTEDILTNFAWYFLPVVNPDGYSFSWTDNRQWRKTRYKTSDNWYIFFLLTNNITKYQYRSTYPSNLCVGTDANRNFDIEWAGIGSSDISCTPTYHGPSAASEIEVLNLQNYLKSIDDPIAYYQNMHSYSQLILYPWGYKNELTPDADDQQRIGDLVSIFFVLIHYCKENLLMLFWQVMNLYIIFFCLLK